MECYKIQKKLTKRKKIVKSGKCHKSNFEISKTIKPKKEKDKKSMRGVIIGAPSVAVVFTGLGRRPGFADVLQDGVPLFVVSVLFFPGAAQLRRATKSASPLVI